MDALRITMLGTLHVSRGEAGQELRLTRSVQSLLAYLLLHRHRLHAREALAGLLWGNLDEERARSCLSTALWRLRQALEPNGTGRGTYLVTPVSGEVGFNQESEHWLDVDDFESASESATSKPFHSLDRHDAERLERALSLYTGDLMEGFSEDWMLRARERYWCLHLNALMCLAQYHGYHGEYEKGLSFGQRVLAMDPLREEMHRYLMRVYLETGERAAAVRQYETCREVLTRELNIEPMEETKKLWARALGKGASEGPMTRIRARGEPLEQAICELRDAVRGFQDAKGALERAVALVERLSFAQEG